MSPQSFKKNLNNKIMASNGYSGAEVVESDSKNNSPPCESVNCMCAWISQFYFYFYFNSIYIKSCHLC